MPYSEAQKNAILRYKQKSVVRIALDFNRHSEKDMVIYDYLNSLPNKTQYVKALVWEDMHQGVSVPQEDDVT